MKVCYNIVKLRERALARQMEDISMEDFEIYENCLDTHIKYVGENEEIIQEIFYNEINNIDSKIGFTHIDFDN